MQTVTTVMGLFCDDIRPEIAGTDTIVGVMPDNITVPHKLPIGIPKFSIYLRINIDAEQDPGPISMKVVLPSGTEIPVGSVERTVVDAARANAKRDGNPISGLISRVALSPFPIVEEGRMRAIVRIGDQEFLACALNIRVDEKAKPNSNVTISTLPWPLSEQSQPASPPKAS